MRSQLIAGCSSLSLIVPRPFHFLQLGLASVLLPWLGDRGVVSIGPSVAKVAERVQAAYSEALHAILLPELNRQVHNPN